MFRCNRGQAFFRLAWHFTVLFSTIFCLAQNASGFNAIVAFGDSYTDTGNAPSSPPDYWNGRFSNGPLWIEYLAQQLGFAYNSYDNHAVSGTESNELGVEINNFPGTSDSDNVLFAIWSGNNDFGNHLNIGYNDAGWDNQINSVVYSLTTASDLLYQKGARQIILFNQIDLTRVPYILNSYPSAFRSYISGKIQIFNSRLSQAMPGLLNSHPGLTIYYVDAHNDVNYLLDSYSSLGFTKASVGALNDPNLSDRSFSGPGASYVFWDSEHPTTMSHALIAKWVGNLLPPPPPPPPPPTVSISGPSSGATFVAPATVSVTAAVSSNAWAVTEVDFFENGSPAGQVTSPPYGLSLPFLPVGTYAFSASMTYGSGSVVTSSPVQFTVSAPAAGALPSPWQHVDIGSVGQVGSAGYNSNGTFVVSGSGADIWDVTDAFHFLYQPFVGNATLTARITSIGNSDGLAKTGLMFRHDLGSNAANVLVFLDPSSGAGFQFRSVTNGATISEQTNSVAPPYWLRLRRTNDTFIGYDSADGTNWTYLGSVTNQMGPTLYAGIAVTAHNNSLLCTSTLDNVQAIRTIPLVAPTLSLSLALPNSLQLSATGSIGATYVCIMSTNLTSWVPIATNLNTFGTNFIPIPLTKARSAFFRVLVMP